MDNELNIRCLGYSVFSKTLDHLPPDQKILISTINQYSYCIAEKDNEFKEALSQSDVLLPDGVGIVAAAKFLYGKKIKKIAGADIHEYLLKKMNREGGSCFYFGSSDATLDKIKVRIAKEYSNIRIATYSPPFKTSFSLEENNQMIAVINEFQPDVIFVGMTAPKQEKWSFLHKNALDATTICSIGAVFDFYAGSVERPNKFWINLGLEWFGRLIKEPKRMWKRYIYYGVVFGVHLIREKLKIVTKPR